MHSLIPVQSGSPDLPRTRIGDYVIVAEVEVGEAGTFYDATHVLLPRRVRLKVMNGSTIWSRAAAMAVLREACLLEALSHPGIPRIYECGMLQPDKRPWIAFELLEGPTLPEVVRGTMPISDVVILLRDVADILRHAHGRGVVHRRLTANAIIQTPERTFGYAVSNWDSALTVDTKAVDTKAIDPREDVYTLGVIAFRALTGRMPDGHSTVELLPTAPAELAKLIDQMLMTEPVARPTSAEVKERAKWLATTVEPLMAAPRWTPPHGLDDRIPQASSQFSIRISRTRSS